MIQDIPQEEEDNLSQVDLELALTFLEQVTLPPFCVKWTTGFQTVPVHGAPISA
jgi:hypothetical protein